MKHRLVGTGLRAFSDRFQSRFDDCEFGLRRFLIEVPLRNDLAQPGWEQVCGTTDGAGPSLGQSSCQQSFVTHEHQLFGVGKCRCVVSQVVCIPAAVLESQHLRVSRQTSHQVRAEGDSGTRRKVVNQYGKRGTVKQRFEPQGNALFGDVLEIGGRHHQRRNSTS